MEIVFRKKVPESERPNLEYLITFFAKCLFTEEENKDIKIYVSVLKTVRDAGLCSMHIEKDNTYFLTIGKWIYTDLDEHNRKWYLAETIAHEMVHIWQYYKKHLTFNENDAIYKGVIYPDPYSGKLVSDLLNLPWEIEAFTLQCVLKDLWVFDHKPRYVWEVYLG